MEPTRVRAATGTRSSRAGILPVVAIGAAAFVAGVGGTWALTSWQAAQRDRIAALEQQLALLQAMPTRAETPDLTSVAPITATVEQSVSAAIRAPQPTTLEGSVAAALVTPPAASVNTQGLEEQIAAARALAAQIKLERLAQGQVVGLLQQDVLAGAYTVEAQSVTDSSIGVSLRSQNHPNTADLLAGILAQAAGSGDLEVPDYIAVSETGEVDSGTLLFDLVQRSLQNGTEAEVAAAEELSRRTVEAFQTAAPDPAGLNGPTISPVARGELTGPTTYIVEEGDNLAYIALQFYGRTDAYTAIFAANRDVLDDPNRIMVGQRLVIPEA